MQFQVDKGLYSKLALMKAAYHFTDDYYVLLDQNDKNYIIDISQKSDADMTDIEKKFANELLAQSTREAILAKTANIRELILARAFASTIIEDDCQSESMEVDEQEYGDDELFKDWYKK